jgi:hypothetical protein
VVEDRLDPLQVGRVRVRVFGFHDENKSLIPTEDLPWAVGVAGLSPKEGDLVFGFFIDGTDAQQPMVMGVVPGIPKTLRDASDGFADPRTDEELKAAPIGVKSVTYKNDGSGVTITDEDPARYPKNLDEPTVPRPVRNDNIDKTVIGRRKKNKLSKIKTAEDDTWNEPATSYNAVYPYNKAIESESGHIIEIDDTPDWERVSFTHRSGSAHEFHPSGSFSEKITKNKYSVVLADDHVYISGKVKVTVGGKAKIRFNGDVSIEAPNAKLNLTKDLKIKAKNISLEADESINLKAKNTRITSTEETSVHSDSKTTVFGEKTEVGSSTQTTVSAVTKLDLNGTERLNMQAIRISVTGKKVSFPKGAAGKATKGDEAETTGLKTPTLESEHTASAFTEPTPTERAGFALDGLEDGVEDFIAKQITDGTYTQDEISEDMMPEETENQQVENQKPFTQDCGGIEKLTDAQLVDSLKLSNHFNLGQLSSRSIVSRTPIQSQRGLSKQEIVCNLKLLAINCLDKIKEKYPDMVVTNAFRAPEGASAGRSQHEIGQAADLQFASGNENKELYFEIAKWIRDNVPFDQLLLEYKTTGSRLPWIHISFNKDGNRPFAPGTTKVATLLNHKKKTDGLTRLV